MNARQEICFFVEDLEFPPRYGGQLAVYHRIIAFSGKFHISVIVGSNVATDKNYILENELKKQGIRILFVEKRFNTFDQSSILYKIFIVLRWGFSRLPYNSLLFYTSTNIKKVRRFLSVTRYTYLIFERPYLSALVKASFIKKDVKCVLVAHNYEKKHFVVSNPIKYPFLKRCINSYELRKIDLLEKMLFRRSDFTLAFSKEDIESYRKNYKVSRIFHCNVILPVPDKSWLPNTNSNYIIYPGPLTYKPNLVGFKWFMSEILQEFIKNNQHVQIIVTGDCPEDIKAGELQKAFIFTGFVSKDEWAELLVNSMFCIIPTANLTGVRIKLIEALSYGVPVLSNSRELCNNDEQPYVYAENRTDFLDKLTLLSNSKKTREFYSGQAHAYYTRKFSYEESLNKWFSFFN